MGFVDYFLMSRTSSASRAQGPPVGPARQRSGSVVSYCLYITGVDRSNTALFRAFQPERVTLPVIDMTSASAAAARSSTTSPASTARSRRADRHFGTMGAKNAILDVAASRRELRGDGPVRKQVPNALHHARRVAEAQPPPTELYDGSETVKR
jgi:hypothetical protein